MTIIDADGHVVEPPDLWDRYLPAAFRAAAPRSVVDEEGYARYRLEGRLTPRLAPVKGAGRDAGFAPPPGASNPVARLADLDTEGIAATVLYPTSGLLLAGVEDPATAVALCRAYNDWLAEFCRTDARRLIGAAAVALQDPEAAAVEARRAAETGFRAVFVRPNPCAGRTLADPAYDALWSACEEAELALGIHEGTTLNVAAAGVDRFPDFASQRAVSHPLEQQLALVALVTSGVLERHPDLCVVFLEASSGWVPYWLERLDRYFEKWSAMLPSLRTRPSELFGRQCWVSCNGDERTLATTAALLGAERLVWASDYPHPDAVFPGAPRALAERPDLTAAAKRAIFADNATALYRLA